MGFTDFVGDIVGNFPSPAINWGLNLYQQHQARGEARDMRNQDAELQREFARNSIRWRVEDAQAAGIHPLAALGASGYNASPSAVGVPPYDYTSPMREMGQNISRAINATLPREERMLNQLRIQRELAEIDLLKAQTTNIMRPQGPAFPSNGDDPMLVGQGNYTKGLGLNDGTVIDTPFKRVVSDPKAPHKQAGAFPDTAITRTKDGYAVVPSKDVKEAIEDSPMEYQWLFRNFFRVYHNPENGRPMLMDPFSGRLVNIPFTKGKKRKSSW